MTTTVQPRTTTPAPASSSAPSTSPTSAGNAQPVAPSPALAPSVVPGAASIPGISPVLAEYLSRPPADETKPPLGLDVFPYGSRPISETPLITEGNERQAIVGAHGTPELAKQLAEGGVANFANPEWMKLIAHAVEQNGGLGNSEDGFLAYSKEMGFVRLRHPGFSPEQNRRLAALSLQTGWPIERLPCRQDGDNTLTDPKAQQWVEEFLGKCESGLAAFVANPKEGLEIKDGSRNGYVMRVDEASGALVSYTYRKRGGFAGFVQKHMNVFGPLLDGLSIVANVVPALGTAVAAGAQLVKTGLQYAATGTLKVGQLIANGASFLGAAFSESFSFLNSQIGKAVTAITADVADDGKLSPLTVVSAAGPLVIKDLPGGPIVDKATQKFAELVAKGAVGGKIGAQDVLSVLSPFVFGVKRGGDKLDLLDGAAQSVDLGHATGSQVSDALTPLIGRLTDDAATQKLLAGGLQLTAKYIDEGRFTAKDFLQALAPAVGRYLKDTPLAKELLERYREVLGERVAA